MMRRAILHIGTEKTGTTTLQYFLSQNRAELAARGFLYPRFCGAVNHVGLAVYSLDPARRDSIQEAFGVTTQADVAPFRARQREAAQDELAVPATVIFSNEHCHSRLTTASEVETLRDFLAEFFDEVRICVYLRRQDQLAVSSYSTHLKAGGVSPNILPETNAEDPYFNYDRSLSLWEAAFGPGAVQVRLFDRQSLTGGSVVSDFAELCGLGPMAGFMPVNDRNESIQPVAQEFLRLVNPSLERLGALPLEAVRGPLAARLDELCPGRGARPSRAAAEAFYNRYRACNEAVRARHFPHRPTLFDDDFSGYPETEDARQITLEAVAGLAARIYMTSNAEIRRLESEVALREARLLWSRDERQAAEAALHRAVRWRPDNAEATRTLAEYLMRQDRLDDAILAITRATEIRPTYHEYWHFLGVLRRRTGALAAAAEAQRRALELNPTHAASKSELAQVELRLSEGERRHARQA